MKVTVLYGGPSAERKISLISGNAVIEGLKSMGPTVFASDISPTDLTGLDHPCDVIFPVLHGQFGESGELQEILEARGLAFVGSGSKASKLGMNKVETKKVWEKAGLPTPKYAVITDKKVPFPGPCVVKAIDSGSSIDVYVCQDETQAPAAIEKIVDKHGRALVEQFINGAELSVSLLEEVPLAPMLIVPKRGFYDFEAKYNANDTEHKFDTGLPAAVIERCRELARKGNAAVGAKDLGRIDIMLTDKFEPFMLEINTLPGFTPKSIFPEAAAHAGIAFGPLVDRLVKRAHARHRAAA
ncbi:D-alanine--D-alanine ligase [soil metagenome]